MKNFFPTISEMTEICEKGRHEDQSQPGAADCDQPALAPIRGWILYDGECRFCIAAANRFQQLFARRGFAFVPLQTTWVQRRLGLKPGAPLEEMRVLTARGDDFGGADAVLYLARQIWWLRPIGWLGTLPLLHSAIDFSYRWVAARRGCTHLNCNVSPHRRSGYWTAAIKPWTALIILPTLTILARPQVEPWLFMWLMVGAIFLGCKWLTLQRANSCIRAASGRKIIYLLLWPGMDAARFLASKRTRSTRSPELPNIGAAFAKIGLGALLLWVIAQRSTNTLLAVWIGMIGLILIVHFGLFGLAASCWRIFGWPARPIMNAPWKAARLSEFWGRRWNRAFQQLVVDTLFRPLSGSLGVVRATLITFFISGLLHEVVISLPAGSGYGLPTGYFLLQGWGIIAQRTPIGGRRWFNNRFFTLFLVTAPVFGLFHPPFVRGVIVPFMHVIGAL